MWRLLCQFIRGVSRLSRSPSLLLDTDIVLEDALGRVIRLPYEHFQDYSMVSTRLQVAFKDCSGEVKVAREEFHLAIKGVPVKSLGPDPHNWNRIYPGARVRMYFHVLNSRQCTSCGSEYDLAEWLFHTLALG